MIYGIGTDITEVCRFRSWVKNPAMIARFFNEKERFPGICRISVPVPDRQFSAACQHYAVRFAAKEAFAKALGTGFSGFDLRDVFIERMPGGKPELRVQKMAAVQLQKKCGVCRLFVSLSHEKEFATAVVVIETGEKKYDTWC